MTQLQFTLDFEKLKAEVMASGELSDVLKSAIVLMMNQFMEKERDEYIKASAYERNSDRQDYRNGYYGRDLILKIGKVTLRVPRTRNGGFDTQAFDKYQRCEQSLLVSMLEMVVNGVSTRKVTNIVKQLCGEEVSKSFVSSLTESLEPEVKAWTERPLNVMYYPFIYTDATYIKVREEGRVVSKAVYIALGVNYKGKREILGLRIGQQESEHEWTAFFQSLKARGVNAPKMIISDAHKGLKAAITEQFTGASWQRCVVHFLKNLTNKMPRKDSEEARASIKTIFRAENLDTARQLRDEFFERYQGNKKYEDVLKCLDEGFDDATQFYQEEDQGTHKHIKSTNVLERLNSEVKRRTNVIRIFPHTRSSFRLIGAVMMDYAETLDRGGRKYIYFK